MDGRQRRQPAPAPSTAQPYLARMPDSSAIVAFTGSRTKQSALPLAIIGTDGAIRSRVSPAADVYGVSVSPSGDAIA